jgi:hypothetical protein
VRTVNLKYFAVIGANEMVRAPPGTEAATWNSWPLSLTSRF